MTSDPLGGPILALMAALFLHGWGSAVSTFTLPQPADTSYIELTINSTYPGTAYEDTCISEIELH